MSLADDSFDAVLMVNRSDKKAVKEIVESPEARGCGLRISRELPEYLPKDLRKLPHEEAYKKLEERVLEVAILSWNKRAVQTIRVQWFDEPPQEPGYYWFYGDPHMGEMGGHYAGTVPPDHRLILVQIHRIANGVTGVANGHFIPLRKWSKDSRAVGVVGKWCQATVPDTSEL